MVCPPRPPRPPDPPAVLRELYGDGFDLGAPNGTGTVVVVGMHNSGTSLVTRLLMLMGVFAGKRKDLAIAEQNPIKWYERPGVFLFHEMFLKNHSDPHFKGYQAQSLDLEDLSEAELHRFEVRSGHPPSTLREVDDDLLCPDGAVK
jgi:hypothetical protein